MITEKFKNLFDFANKSKIKAGDGLEKGKYPLYTSSSVLSKRIDIAQHDEKALIFGTGGSASVHFVNEPFSTSTDCLVAISNSQEINTKYVYYFLSGNLHILERGFKGAGLKHISKKYIQEIDIPVLPLETQNKIVEVLDKADSLVKKREQTIELLDELLRATFLDMFGDPTSSEKFKVTTLLKYLEKIQIGPFGSQLHQSDYVQNEIPLINPVNIIDKNIEPDYNTTITKTKYQSLPNYHLKCGDIIMARRGEMGRCGLISQKEDNWFCGTGSLYLRPKNINQSVFLLFCLTNTGTIEYLNKNAKGITMKNLNKSIIANIPIIECPIELQEKFGKLYHNFNKLKNSLIKNLEEVLTLQLSLSQDIFNEKINLNTTSLINKEKQLDNKINIAAEPTVVYHKIPKFQEKEDKHFVKRKVLASYIINQSLNDKQFGDVKFEKLLHLADYFAIQRNFGQNYYKKAMGPYDNGFTYPFFQQVIGGKWFKKVNYGKLNRIIAGEKHQNSLKTYDYFSDEELQKINTLIGYFKKSNYEQPEIISTLYAVWNNRIIKKQEITDELIKEDFLNWDSKKAKYKGRLDGALNWMRKEGVIPNGWGKYIDKKKKK